MKFQTRRSLLSLAIPLVLAGCLGGSDKWVEKLPKTVEASGTVTLNGKPVAGASIVAMPVTGKHAARALTDDDGDFALKAFKAKPGAVPGQYKITISKTVTINAQGERVAPGSLAASSTLNANGDHAAPATGGWKNVIPHVYANPKSSGLTIDIPSEGLSDIQFQLQRSKE